MPDLITCGEILVDFVSTQPGLALIDAPSFTRAAGGAPANVAVGAARLGLSSGCMGMVGDDVFGHFLAQTLRHNSVDTSALHFTAEARTPLAFVSLRDDGDRDFIFYRNPGADMLFSPEHVASDYISQGKIFHYGSISLSAERSMAATLYAVELARKHGLVTSYDPNLRLNLWPSDEAARDSIHLGWGHANVVKVSEEELFFLTSISEPERAARSVWHNDLRLMIVTLASRGSLYFTPTSSGAVPGFDVPVADTTGAGDAFLAALLYKLYPLLDVVRAGHPDVRLLDEALRFANAAGAITTTRPGAIPGLPTLAEVNSFLQSRGEE